MTNNHVVSENNNVVLVNAQGEKMSAEVVLRDEDNDIALLEVDRSQKLPPALPLATSPFGLAPRCLP